MIGFDGDQGLDSAQLPPSESIYVWFPWVKAKNGAATRGELSNFSHLYSVPLKGKSLYALSPSSSTILWRNIP